MSMLLRLCLLFVGCILQMNLAKAQDYGTCSTPNRELCIELNQCPEIYTLLQNPNKSPSVIDYVQRMQCGYMRRKVLICCPNRMRCKVPSSTQTSFPRFTGTGRLPQAPECGTVLSNKILGGNVTLLDEFPWMALIEYTKPGNAKGHHCGGTLISNRYVLTAAHCVTGRNVPKYWSPTGVRLGEWDTTTNPDCETDIHGNRECVPEHLDVDVAHWIAHPAYNTNARNQLNDIALLRLSEIVTKTTHIQPICLPSSASLRNHDHTGTVMDVAGWGQTETKASNTQKLKASVKVWDFARCRATYTMQNLTLGTSQLCAGGESGIDSCIGDSGGPLMYEKNVSGRNVFFLIGVVSFGPAICGLSGWPGVYTRVGAHIDWIQNNIQ